MDSNIFAFAPTQSQNRISENFLWRKRPTKAKASRARESHGAAPLRGDVPPAASAALPPASPSTLETTSEEDGIVISSAREEQMNREAKSFLQGPGVGGGCLAEVAGPSPGRRMGQVSRACDDASGVEV